MNKTSIFYSIFVVLIGCQLQAMEQPHSPLNVPLIPLRSAQTEFDKVDLEELAKTADLGAADITSGLSLPPTPVKVKSVADFSRSPSKSSPLKRLAAETLSLPATPIQPIDFSLSSLKSSPLKPLAADVMAIPAAQVLTQIPETNKRKKEDNLYQCQAPNCYHKNTFSKLRNHILITHLNYRFHCPQEDCIKNFKYNNDDLLKHLKKIILSNRN